MIGLAMMLAAAPAFPPFVSGKELYGWCTGDGQTLCISYIMGVSDTLSEFQIAGSLDRSKCTAPTAAAEDLKAAVVAYLRRYPAKGSQGAAGLVTAAIVQAFPCPKS